MTTTIDRDIIDRAIDFMNDSISEDQTFGNDLHNAMFNEDYFIIGYYEAEQFLKSTKCGIFGAIEMIQTYEKENFGETTTDCGDSEKVVNMYAYIQGEKLLSSIEALTNNYDVLLDSDMIDAIKAELEAL